MRNITEAEAAAGLEDLFADKKEVKPSCDNCENAFRDCDVACTLQEVKGEERARGYCRELGLRCDQWREASE